ncbi:sialic acid-binding Ig-like lectin 13 [Pteronotus mesoamericanus]|uniref:sialic acid-binding Ig-like lectin 13 n=1 Tax=Pteronotus mesoamericanus TaxID=1884717 RepID=UPI0023EC51C5|nr:sialic acid-binding Ig-like lectin 13 [Pteronotus parnellii mesoamericanus]
MAMTVRQLARWDVPLQRRGLCMTPGIGGVRLPLLPYVGKPLDSCFLAKLFLPALIYIFPSSLRGAAEGEEGMSPRLLLLLLMLWEGFLAQCSSARLTLQSPVTVQESLCVLVPCRFSHSLTFFKTVNMFWFRKDVNMNQDLLVATTKPKQKLPGRTQGRFFLPMDPKSNNCSLSIRDANKRDNGTYFFQIENYFERTYSYTDKMLSLKVTDLTHTPDILIPGALECGRPTNLTCSVPWACEQGTPPLFSWTSAAPAALGPSTRLSSVLTLRPRAQDHGSALTCQVQFPATGVTVGRTVRLNVSYAPQTMAIHIFQGNSTALKILQTTSLPILEGEALRLLCVADSNPPAQLSWSRGSPSLNSTLVSSTSILELPRMGTGNEGQFTCQAQHPLGSRNLSLSLSVVYPPRLLGPFCSWEDQGLRCSCSSRGQPAPSLRWRLGEGLLAGNHSNASHAVTSRSAGPWANGSLSLRAGLGAGLRLSCEAENVHGAQSGGALLLPGKPETSGVLGAAGGTSIVALALLSLCLCLVFRVKTCREKAVQQLQRVDHNGNPVVGSGSGVHPHRFLRDSPSAHPPPDGASPIAKEEQELQYAFLRFHNLRRQEQEGTNTVYSEIKTH